MKTSAAIALAMLLAAALPAPLLAQQPSVEPVAAVSPQTPDEREGHERIFVVMPAFGVTDHQDAPALSSRQKFSLAARQAFDPFMWASTGIQAGISQAENEFPAYGQGTAGYSKRYASAMADNIGGSFATTAFLVALHQDPRYFRLGHGSVLRRATYSATAGFVCKSDSGRRQVNWSNVLGTFVSSGISNAYYPRANRGLGLTLNRATVSLLWGFTGGLTDEFGPDVSRRIFHRHQQP
jgi:hypothetical protein